MKLSKKSLTGAVAALAFAVVTAGCGEVNIGYVNQDRLNDECPQIKASIEEWQGKLNELQETANNDLNQAVANGASDDELKKIQQDAQMKAAGLNQQYQAQMRAKVDAAIDDIAKAKKLDTVVKSTTQENTVISGGTDITDDIIQKLQ